MKLLFDQNLSHRLVGLLATEFPGSQHVRDAGLATASDPALWAYAATQGLVIVSKDTDFQHRSLLFGHPPKVVWVRLGNCSTAGDSQFAAGPAVRPARIRGRPNYVVLGPIVELGEGRPLVIGQGLQENHRVKDGSESAGTRPWY